jgi:hypothetical protein
LALPDPLGAVDTSSVDAALSRPDMIVPARARSRARAVIVALVLTVVAFVVLLVVKPGGAALVVRISDIGTAAAAALACVACVFAARRSASSTRPFWWVLAAASGAWACAEVIWAWYDLVLRVDVPSPSWADVGYLAAPVLVVIAFSCHPATRNRERWGGIPILDGLAVASALLFISWTLVLGPVWSSDGGYSLGSLVDVAYPFSDVVILVLVVLVLRDLQPGDRMAIALLLAGLVFMAGSDTVYTYLTQTGSYTSGDVIDAGWVAAYLAIAGAAYESRASGVGTTARTSPGALSSVLVPYIPILATLVAIPVEIARGVRLNRVEWGIAMCLIAVVLARQVVDLLHRQAAQRRSVPTSPHRRKHVPAAADPAFPHLSTPRGEFPHLTTPRGELATLTLQMVAAARPTAQERVQRVSATVIMALTSVGSVLALWDLSLLVRHAG